MDGYYKDEWEVKLVKKKQLSDGEVEYPVEWNGPHADEWQPESCLTGSADDALSLFLSESNKKQAKRKKKK